MKHVKGVKIRPLSVLTGGQKPKHNRLKKQARLGPKGGYNGKWHKETPKEVEPFFNIEEGLNISTKSVHDSPEIRSHIC